jgi:hypothetical protein
VRRRNNVASCIDIRAFAARMHGNPLLRVARLERFRSPHSNALAEQSAGSRSQWLGRPVITISSVAERALRGCMRCHGTFLC